MSHNSKKLAKMYEEYLRESMESSNKKEVVDKFVSTVMSMIDFTNPEVAAHITKVLLKYEQYKSARHTQGDEHDEPASSGDELDFSSMYKPKDFNDLADHLNAISVSHANELEIEDVLNAATIIKSVRPYMFETEVPWVGMVDGILCLSWADKVGKELMLAFVHGIIQLESMGEEEARQIELNEEGKVEKEDILQILVRVNDVLVY